MSNYSFTAPDLIARSLARRSATAFVLPLLTDVREIDRCSTCESVFSGIWQWSNRAGELLLSRAAPYSPGDEIAILEHWCYDFELDAAGAASSAYRYRADWPDANAQWRVPSDSGFQPRTCVAVRACWPTNRQSFDSAIVKMLDVGSTEDATARLLAAYLCEAYPTFVGEWFWVVEIE